jgi:inner membrane protein
MATFLTHAVVGLALGKTAMSRPMPLRFWVLAVTAACLPDLDLLGAFVLGIPYNCALGHRGLTHSLVLALVVGPALSLLALRRDAPPPVKRWPLAAFFFLVMAGHGLIDAATNGSLGVALFWPFDSTRYFLPWHPIAVSPTGWKGFFVEFGGKVLLSEFLWVWVPLGVLMAAAWLWRRAATGRPSVAAS